MMEDGDWRRVCLTCGAAFEPEPDPDPPPMPWPMEDDPSEPFIDFYETLSWDVYVPVMA
jgi:hypothetical protein